MYVKSGCFDVEIVTIKKPKPPTPEPDFEAISCRIIPKMNTKDVTVITTVYIPPDMSRADVEWEKAIPTNTHVLIGDVNAHGEWSSADDTAGERLHEWFLHNDFVVLNEEEQFTRMDPATGGTTSPDIIAVKIADVA